MTTPIHSKVQFPYLFNDTVQTELGKRGIPAPVGRMILGYCGPRKRVVVFLNSKVLFDQRKFQNNEQFKQQVHATKDRLFPRKFDISAVHWMIAKSYHFDEAAVKAFENLVSRVCKIADIAIVIFDAWKEDLKTKTLQQKLKILRDRIYDRCSFSHLICDVTPTLLSSSKLDGKYAIEIASWMQKHQIDLKITDEVLIDQVSRTYIQYSNYRSSHRESFASKYLYFVQTEHPYSSLSQEVVDRGLIKFEQQGKKDKKDI